VTIAATTDLIGRRFVATDWQDEKMVSAIERADREVARKA